MSLVGQLTRGDAGLFICLLSQKPSEKEKQRYVDPACARQDRKKRTGTETGTRRSEEEERKKEAKARKRSSAVPQIRGWFHDRYCIFSKIKMKVKTNYRQLLEYH